MKTLVQSLGLRSNPFEHYTAETEPFIASYAVRPPYLQAISDRVKGLSTFILFGDRGAGKSATRITVYNEIWGQATQDSNNDKAPFVVNQTDFSSIQEAFRKDRLTERDIVNLVGFTVVEQILVWLSSLDEEERNIYIEELNDEERILSIALIRGFYLVIAENDRAVSTRETLRLLNSAWTTKSVIWASKRWDALSKIVSAAVGLLSRKTLDNSVDVSLPVEALLRSLTGDAPNAPRAALSKLVEFVKSFGFSGVSVLIDKVDETPATANSAELTTKLIILYYHTSNCWRSRISAGYCSYGAK